MAYREYNFDGLVGPTHNYAGLGTGNLASMASKHHISSPKAAALEGLEKMKLVAELGIPQAILPPQRRPHVGYLRARYDSRHHLEGLRPRGPSEQAAPGDVTGPDTAVDPAHAAAIAAGGSSADPWYLPDRRPTTAEVTALLRAAAENGEEGRRDLAIASSASAMWAANAATVSPSPDTADGRLHITPANLVSQPHRALEAAERHRVLAHIFEDAARFAVHAPLPREMPDEGAANHTRLTSQHGARGLEVFTYGYGLDVPPAEYAPKKFRPRQSLAASHEIVSRHMLALEHCFEVQQAPAMIDEGVFHNDVIAVGNENLLLIQDNAWVGRDRKANWLSHAAAIADLREAFGFVAADTGGGKDAPLYVHEVPRDLLPVADAVRSYLFNSQLVTLPSGEMALIYPAECDEVPTARAAIERILREDNPVERAVRVDVRQSMKNGGGPACLRLRVVLSDEERAAVRGNVFWTPEIHETLVEWVHRHYRDTLTPQDLADVRLYEESMAALDELSEILELPI